MLNGALFLLKNNNNKYTYFEGVKCMEGEDNTQGQDQKENNDPQFLFLFIIIIWET